MSGTNSTDVNNVPATAGAAVGGGGSGGTSVGGSTEGVTLPTLPPQYSTGNLGFFTRQTESVPTGVTVGPDGAAYVTELNGIPYPAGYASVVRVDGTDTTTGFDGVTPSGVPQDYASGFTELQASGFDGQGNLYVLEYLNSSAIYDPTQTPADLPPSQLIKVAPDGVRTTISGPELKLGNNLLVDPKTGDIYVATNNASEDNGEIIQYHTDQATGAVTNTVVATGLADPRGMAFGPDGNLYVLNQGDGTSQTSPDASTAPVIPFIPGLVSESGGYTGSISKVDITSGSGAVSTVFTGLPSFREFNPSTGQDRVISVGPNSFTIGADGTAYIASGGGLAPETAAAIGSFSDDLQGVVKITGLFGSDPANATVAPAFNSLTYAQNNGPDGATTQFNTESNLNDITVAPNGDLYAVDAARNDLYTLSPDGNTVLAVTVINKQAPVLTPPQYAAVVASGGDPTAQYEAELSGASTKDSNNLPAVPGEIAVSTDTASSSVPTAPATAAYPAVVLGNGPNTLDLKIGEDAYQGDAQFTIAVDGTQVGGVQTAQASQSAGDSQDFIVLGAFGGGQQHTVTVNFLNDLYDGSPDTDRNLYVDGVTYNGTPATQQSLVLNSAGAQSLLVGTTPLSAAASSAAVGGALGGSTADVAPRGEDGTNASTIAALTTAATTTASALPTLPLNTDGSSAVPGGAPVSPLPGPTDPVAAPVLAYNVDAPYFNPFFGNLAPAASDPLALPAGAQGSYTVNNLFVFGDRLADDGSVNRLLGLASPATSGPYSPTGDFTDGAKWTTDLAEILGAQQNSPITDFAYSSATAQALPLVSDPNVPSDPIAPLLDFSGQINLFESTGQHFTSNDLVSVTFGGNDLSFPSTDTPDQAISGAVKAITDGLTDLAGLGAKHFLVSTLPDITLAPLFSNPAFLAATGATQAGFQGLVSDFNTQLQAGLSAFQTSTGLDVKSLDLNALFNGIAANPSAYGFSNTTQPVLINPPTPGSTPTYNPAIVGQDPQVQHSSLFLDPYFDPTSLGQTIIAQTARSTLTA